MFEPISVLLDTVLGKSLDTVGKLKSMSPSRRRRAAQALLSFYEDLEKLKLSALHVDEEVESIIRFHENGEYDAHTIENYVDGINEAHEETVDILRHMFLHYNPEYLRWCRGVHVRNVRDFLSIKDPKLAADVEALIGIKFTNLMVLLNCFEFVHEKQKDKSLRVLHHITGIDTQKIKEGRMIFADGIDPKTSFDELNRMGFVRTSTLDAGKIEQLRLFRRGIDDFLSKVDEVREKIRTFLCKNFDLEEIL